MKKIFFCIGLMIVSFFMENGVNALTKTDFDYIETELHSFVYYSSEYNYDNNETVYSYFNEGINPNVKLVQNYIFWNLIWEMDNYEYKYIVNQNFEQNYENVKVQIPKTVFENEVEKHFIVLDEFYINLQENFSPEFSVDSEYKEIDGKYYYYSENRYNLGGTIDLMLKGYKDLGNNCYQLYFYNLDYVDEENIIYYTSKVHYNDKTIKYLSFESMNKNDFPEDSELILYEDLTEEEQKEYKFLDGTKQEFDISKDKGLTFRIDADFNLFNKVYIDNKEVDEANYKLTEGSTIITFNDEYSKKLSNGEHKLKVTLKDGNEVSTTFTIKQNVKNPDTGIELGYGALIILLLISSVSYVLIRKQSKFPKHN